MKKQYESTTDEAVEASYRLAEIVGSVSRQRWLGLIWALVVVVIILALPSDQPGVKRVFACCAGIVVAGLHLLTVNGQFRKAIRKILIKANGTDKPIPSEYELSDAHLIFRKCGQELRLPWNGVVDIIQTAAVIEVHYRPTGIAIIPKRIFTDEAEFQTWLRFIEEHRMANKASEVTSLRSEPQR